MRVPVSCRYFRTIAKTMSSEKAITCIFAFCDGNRGIGYKGGLPWPYLKEDFEFYNAAADKTKDPNKKSGIVMGRRTWSELSQMNGPKRQTIIISSTMSKDTPGIRTVVPSYDDAVAYCNGPDAQDLENIKVMGGNKVYEAAFADPRCKRLIATRVFKDFPADTFIPPFEHSFHKVSDPEVDGKMREENGVKFCFEVWERMSS